MNKTYSERIKRRNFQIRHKSQIVNLDRVLPLVALKKAHHIVRDFIRAEWAKSGQHTETSAYIFADGEYFGKIQGFHRDRNIQIIHKI